MYKTTDAQLCKNTHLTEHTHAHIKHIYESYLSWLKNDELDMMNCLNIKNVKECEFLYDMDLRHERVNEVFTFQIWGCTENITKNFYIISCKSVGDS